MLELFDPDRTYDLIWLLPANDISFPAFSFGNLFDIYSNLLGKTTLIDRYDNSSIPFANNWSGIVYNSLKRYSNTALVANSEEFNNSQIRTYITGKNSQYLQEYALYFGDENHLSSDYNDYQYDNSNSITIPYLPPHDGFCFSYFVHEDENYSQFNQYVNVLNKKFLFFPKTDKPQYNLFIDFGGTFVLNSLRILSWENNQWIDNNELENLINNISKGFLYKNLSSLLTFFNNKINRHSPNYNKSLKFEIGIEQNYKLGLRWDIHPGTGGYYLYLDDAPEFSQITTSYNLSLSQVDFPSWIYKSYFELADNNYAESLNSDSDFSSDISDFYCSLNGIFQDKDGNYWNRYKLSLFPVVKKSFQSNKPIEKVNYDPENLLNSGLNSNLGSVHENAVNFPLNLAVFLSRFPKGVQDNEFRNERELFYVNLSLTFDEVLETPLPILNINLGSHFPSSEPEPWTAYLKLFTANASNLGNWQENIEGFEFDVFRFYSLDLDNLLTTKVVSDFSYPELITVEIPFTQPQKIYNAINQEERTDLYDSNIVYISPNREDLMMTDSIRVKEIHQWLKELRNLNGCHEYEDLNTPLRGNLARKIDLLCKVWGVVLKNDGFPCQVQNAKFFETDKDLPVGWYPSQMTITAGWNADSKVPRALDIETISIEEQCVGILYDVISNRILGNDDSEGLQIADGGYIACNSFPQYLRMMLDDFDKMLGGQYLGASFIARGEEGFVYEGLAGLLHEMFAKSHKQENVTDESNVGIAVTQQMVKEIMRGLGLPVAVKSFGYNVQTSKMKDALLNPNKATTGNIPVYYNGYAEGTPTVADLLFAVLANVGLNNASSFYFEKIATGEIRR